MALAVISSELLKVLLRCNTRLLVCSCFSLDYSKVVLLLSFKMTA